MHSRPKLHLVVLNSALALTCISFVTQTVRADDIAAVVDAHGRKVYVNTGESRARPSASKQGRVSAYHNGGGASAGDDIQQMVRQTADKHRVDPHLVHAIIKTESDYNPFAVSRKGAMGLMQLIPATAQRLGVTNPFDPRQNIEGGVAHLKYLMNLFGGDLGLSLAAYNAGEKSVLRAGGIPRFSETRDYVRKVTSLYNSSAFSPEIGPKQDTREPLTFPIRTYVDQNGIVHFTNVD